MRQVEEKIRIQRELRQKDKDDFNAVGKYASNKYYVNQDKKDNAIQCPLYNRHLRTYELKKSSG